MIIDISNPTTPVEVEQVRSQTWMNKIYMSFL
ncbi:MAG: hypothetical protein ACTSQ5_03345 [Promethearchaeota archaeon]